MSHILEILHTAFGSKINAAGDRGSKNHSSVQKNNPEGLNE